MDISSHVAGKVSAAIELAGETQASVARTTGIPRVTLIRRLTGRTPFTVTELFLIADALNVDWTTFVDDNTRAAS